MSDFDGDLMNMFPIDIKPPTPQETFDILVACTVIDPTKFEFMDRKCTAIWTGGICYVRNQEAYDKAVESYKDECGLRKPSQSEKFRDILIDFTKNIISDMGYVNDYIEDIDEYKLKDLIVNSYLYRDLCELLNLEVLD